MIYYIHLFCPYLSFKQSKWWRHKSGRTWNV